MRTLEALDAPFALADDAVDFGEVDARYPAMADFAARLGGTPVIDVPGPPHGAKIVAKCEWENPVGSVKDRVAYALLARALADHGDRPLDELRILEYSGGNLARSLAYLCRAVGVRSRFVLSSASPASLLDLLRENGSEAVLVDREEGFLGVIQTALEIAAAEPEWTLLYQHRNAANPQFHRDTTGAELASRLHGTDPAAWVASIGTGGTLIGVLHALRETYPGIRAVGVTPAELPYGSDRPPNGLPKYAGSGGFGNGLRQPIVALHDDEVEHRVVSLPRSLAEMGRFRELTGLRIGTSAAANWLAAWDVAATLPASKTVVTVFPDAGSPEEWEQVP